MSSGSRGSGNNGLLIIISTSLTVPGQRSPRFHVEACYLLGNVK